MKRTAAATIVILLGAASWASAQTSNSRSRVAVRAFFVATGEQFTAKETFKAVFGQSVQPFWGGGVETTWTNGAFVDITVSRFKKTGDRAFVFGGQTFHLGIPVEEAITPIEFSAGMRFARTRTGRPRTVIPYFGLGVGTYRLTETSPASSASDNVDSRHLGYLALGGAEFRLHRSVSAAVDAQYTHVPGLLGRGGVSELVGENDLGGIAARVRFLVGPLFGR